MKIVSLVSQKGGVGKTTLAMNLAVLAEKRGYATVVFDLDPQASITKWKDKRGPETPPDVVPAQQGRLKTLLALAQKQGAQLVIIDTAGSADSAALAAAEVADLILVPARPNGLDLEAVETTVRLAMQHAKRPFHVVLTQTPSQASIAEEAAEVIEGQGSRSAQYASARGSTTDIRRQTERRRWSGGPRALPRGRWCNSGTGCASSSASQSTAKPL